MKFAQPKQPFCPRCKNNDNISFFVELQSGKLGSLMSIALLILSFIPVIGWFALYYSIANTSVRKMDYVTYAMCNKCGNTWLWENKAADRRKKIAKVCSLIYIILTIVIVLSELILKE